MARTEEQYLVPPFARASVRASGSFTVYDGDAKGNKLDIIGPRSSTDRLFQVETADNQRVIIVEHHQDTVINFKAQVRPSPYETNSGIPSELSQPISEPTIQDMVRMYIREAMVSAPDEPETPDEFFDFDVDDEEMHLFHSEYEDMENEYLSEDASEAPDTTNPLPADQGAEGTAKPPEQAQEASDA